MQISTENKWKKLLKNFNTPSFTKKYLIEPIILSKNFTEPILDAGCGTGYFSNLLASKGKMVISVDRNLDKKLLKSCKAIKADLANVKLKNLLVGDVLLINILSCVDQEEKRLEILKNLKSIKNKDAKIYVFNVAEDVVNKEFKSSVIKIEKITKNKVNMTIKQIDGNLLNFDDNIIYEKSFESQCKKANLNILQKKYLKYKKEKNAIYAMYILI
ncbi:class I SAM-dependent methyltransferase [Patescibacteria group bacterium]|nr:class I SAM-dependent methyltransferase [Patescibacteria group bacterium]